MDNEILISLFGLLGIIIGAIPTYLFMRQKNTAEIGKLNAETDKLKAEAEKIRADFQRALISSSDIDGKKGPEKKNVIDAKLIQGKETNLSKGNIRSANTNIPKAYKFSFLKDEIAQRFSKDTGFLVIQYGSSVTNPSKAKDEDYIVLVHGNYYHRESQQEDIGHSISLNSFTSGTTLDIHIRLLDSFLIGLIMGKPYEVSVAIDGKVRDVWQIPKEYWDWLKLLPKNMLIDTNYIREQISEDIKDIKREYHDAFDNNDYYGCIVSAYHYVSDLIKVVALMNYPKIVPALSMYKLSKVEFLEKFVPSEKKEIYQDIVAYFKREKQPNNWVEFSYQLDKLVDALEKNNERIQQ